MEGKYIDEELSTIIHSDYIGQFKKDTTCSEKNDDDDDDDDEYILCIY